MIKKLTRILCVIIVLLLPIGALASQASVATEMLSKAKEEGKEIYTEISFEPGEALAQDEIVADLCDATTINLYSMGNECGAYAIALNGNEVLTEQFLIDEQGFFTQSNLIGENTLYFNWEDLIDLISKYLVENGADEETVNEAMLSLSNGIQQFFSAIDSIDESNDNKELTKEEKDALLQKMFGEDEKMLEWIKAVEEKSIVTTGEFTLEDSDVADTLTTLTLTNEDMAAIYETDYIKNIVTNSITDATLSQAEKEAQADEAIADLVKTIKESNLEVTTSTYTIGEDELVAMQTVVTGIPEDEDSSGNASMDMQIVRKTVDDTKYYTLEMTVDDKEDKAVANIEGNLELSETKAFGYLTVVDPQESEQPLFTITFDQNSEDENDIVGNVKINVLEDTTYTSLSLDYSQIVDDSTITTTLSGYASYAMGSNVDITTDLEGALVGILTIKTTIRDDSGYFDNIKTATIENSTEVLKLDETQLEEFIQTVQNDAIMVLYSAIPQLPESVQTLITSSVE